jgi:putative two-component system response regulator
MVTASFDAAVRYEALERGASDFLNKPVDKVEFIARVRNLLALRESSEALKNRAAWLDTEVKKATASILMRERESIALLCGAAEYRDPETGAHIHRMAHYSRLIAEELRRPLAEQADILAAAPMHDIGKVGTPDAILLKPGRLTDDEMVIMRRHAKNGYDILNRSDAELLRLGALIALNHHEKFDGTGYPQGLRGEEIPLVGRIVAVADVFDALTSARPYKAAWPLADARAHLEKSRGSHFDPDCVDAFLRRWDDILVIREQFHDEEPPQH